MLAARLGGPRAAPNPTRWPMAACAATAAGPEHHRRPRRREQTVALAELAVELSDAAAALTPSIGRPHSDVRMVFSWSYQELSPAAAGLFRLVGLHPGPEITVAAAASLAAVPPDRAGALLRQLTSAHLLAEPVPGRFACHDLLRIFAAEQTRSADSEDERRARRPDARSLPARRLRRRVAAEPAPQSGLAAAAPAGDVPPGLARAGSGGGLARPEYQVLLRRHGMPRGTASRPMRGRSRFSSGVFRYDGTLAGLGRRPGGALAAANRPATWPGRPTAGTISASPASGFARFPEARRSPAAGPDASGSYATSQARPMPTAPSPSCGWKAARGAPAHGPRLSALYREAGNPGGQAMP